MSRKFDQFSVFPKSLKTYYFAGQKTTPKKKKFKRNPLTPKTKGYLRRVYSHHFEKRTMPRKEEALAVLENPEAPEKLKRFPWQKQKEFVRSAIIAEERQHQKMV